MILENKKILNIAIIITGIFYFAHFKFIITSYWPFVVSLVISFLTYVLLKVKSGWKLKILDSIISIYLSVMSLLTILFLVVFFIKGSFKEDLYCVDIKGYSTSRTDMIIFNFRGDKVNRPYTLTKIINEVGENFNNQYNLKLVVKEPVPNVCYIENMEIVPIKVSIKND